MDTYIKGTWFFPSDELLPGEKVEDCIQRVLKQIGREKDIWNNKILDRLPAQPLVKIDDTFSVEGDEDLCKSTTVFTYCVFFDKLSEEDRDTKKRKTNKDGASVSEVSLQRIWQINSKSSDDWYANGTVRPSFKQDKQPQKIDELEWFNWDEIKTICKHKNSKAPFSALRNFIRKWDHVNWDENPWDAFVWTRPDSNPPT